MVDCRKFLDSNSLGLTVAALSSYDPQMRAAAYYVLAAYYSQLEGARFREQPQVSALQGGGSPPHPVEGLLCNTEACCLIRNRGPFPFRE